jgi:phosphoribosylformylglycinamidine (FGAM) synthase-like amidotransferase family enzyme
MKRRKYIYTLAVGLVCLVFVVAAAWRVDFQMLQDYNTGPFEPITTTANTNTVAQGFKIHHETTGTAAAGIGVKVDFSQETAATPNDEIIANITAVTTDVTGASEDADITVATMAGGAAAAERLRISALALTGTASSALTNTINDNLILTHETSGTPAAGIGTGMQFVTETSAANNEIGARIATVTTDVTGATEDFDLTFLTMAGGATAAERLRISALATTGTATSALTNTVNDNLILTHETSGTPAAGIGTGMQFVTETSAANNEIGARIEAVVTDATGASEDFAVVIENMTGGATATEKWRIDSLGITTQTGAVGAIKTFVYQDDALADDASFDLPDATDGFLIATCNAEGGNAIISADGTVTLTAGITANMVAADTDAKFAVFDGGTAATVRNRLGAACVLRVVYYYQ